MFSQRYYKWFAIFLAEQIVKGHSAMQIAAELQKEFERDNPRFKEHLFTEAIAKHIAILDREVK